MNKKNLEFRYIESESKAVIRCQCLTNGILYELQMTHKKDEKGGYKDRDYRGIKKFIQQNQFDIETINSEILELQFQGSSKTFRSVVDKENEKQQKKQSLKILSMTKQAVEETIRQVKGVSVGIIESLRGVDNLKNDLTKTLTQIKERLQDFEKKLSNEIHGITSKIWQNMNGAINTVKSISNQLLQSIKKHVIQALGFISVIAGYFGIKILLIYSIAEALKGNSLYVTFKGGSSAVIYGVTANPAALAVVGGVLVVGIAIYCLHLYHQAGKKKDKFQEAIRKAEESFQMIRKEIEQ